MQMNEVTIYEVATFGGGCFWCLEAIYIDLQGVISVVSGYAGGHTTQPTYQEVCTGMTGHAEVVQIKFDPEQITYRQLVEVFFSIHDPTTLNRQGADVGTQYRSVIFTHNPSQDATAREVMSEIARAGIWHGSIVTQIQPLDAFYPAEEYHQQYFQRNPFQGYCMAVIAPKVAKFRNSRLNSLLRKKV
jgi:peptide-methionine (S)-S-oxide reductase